LRTQERKRGEEIRGGFIILAPPVRISEKEAAGVGMPVNLLTGSSNAGFIRPATELSPARTGAIAVAGFVSLLTRLSSFVFCREPQLVRGMASSRRITRVRIFVTLFLLTGRLLLLLTMVDVRVL
jgi:hypothetical protein